MSDKGKVMVYPFDNEFSAILRHCNLIDGFDIASLVSLNGWGFRGEDAGEIDGGCTAGITVEEDFDTLLQACDALLVNDYSRTTDFYKIIYPRVKSSIMMRKNILCLKHIEEEVENELSVLAHDYKVRFTNYNKRNVNTHVNNVICNDRLDKIDTPVVFIIGVAENTHKFDIQLALREELLKNGFNVSQIGTRSYCEFLNFHSFPKFMYMNISELEKIVMFNHYIKYLEIKEQPDIIVIGIPGGIMKINDDYTNKFGIFAYEISQALLPDFTILSTYYEDYKQEYFSKMVNSIKYRFGYDVDCFNLSNVQFDWIKAKEGNSDIYLTIESSFVDERKKLYDQLSMPVYNILNRYDVHYLAEHLIGKLNGYGRVASI